jgi:hypothetical protein
MYIEIIIYLYGKVIAYGNYKKTFKGRKKLLPDY